MPTLQKPPTVSEDERAQEIYRRAAEVFHEKGFDATSMGDIADAVDLTKGGLYYYIKGKQALLFAIMSFALDLVDKEVVGPAMAEEDCEARLSALVSGLVRLTLREPCAMSILAYEGVGLNDEHYVRIVRRKERLPRVLTEAIAQLLGRGSEAPRLEPALAARSLLGMIHWTDRWYQNSGQLSDEDLADQLTAFALHGLVPRGR